MNTNPNGDLDQQDREILAQLIPEGPEPGTPPIHMGAGSGTDTNEDAPLVASTPAAPAPAATTAPAASPAPTAAPVAATPAASPAPTAAPAQPEHNPGNLRNALRAARHNERQALERAAAAEAEAKRLREQATANGNSVDGEEDPLTMSEDRIAEIAKDFPLQARTIQRLRELDARTKQQAPAPVNQEWTPPAFDPRVQAVIDEVPKLLEWQMNQADQPKFVMAGEFDDSLRVDPVWKNKPAAERFTEAVRRTEAALGASPGAAPSPADSAAAAAALAAAAPSTGKPGLSDFRGGGTAQAPELDFSKMTDVQILGSLVPDA